LSGKITALRAQTRNRERVNVYLDGAFAFGLPAIIAATLRVGQTLSESDIQALRERGDAEQAYERALSFLTYRPRSTQEVRRYLAGKNIPVGLVEQTIHRLTEAGLLNDQEFARYWVENRESFRPRGARALRFELKGKGVGDQAIDAATQEVDEDESAYRIARNQALRLRQADRDTFRRRLGGFLTRRGFSYETVRATVDRLWRERGSEDGNAGLE